MPGPIAGFGTDVDTDALYRRIALLESRSQDPSSVDIRGGTIAGKSVASIAAAAKLSISDYGPTNPIYIAHRGEAALYPEESKLAYDNALFADGEPALECDVQTLSDSSLGLMHDTTVDRTTTGTGNVNTFSATTFKALTMDSSVWLGSNYGDTLNPMMFQDYIDAYKGRAILVPEDKDSLSMTALVRALINSGVSRGQALVQCFSSAPLATAVAAGYQAIGLSGANSPTAAAIAATGAKWAGIAWGDSITPFLAAGLKTIYYTVNRRYIRDLALAQGASGFFSDDPQYLRGSVAVSKTDFFARQTWVPGMLCSADDVGVNTAYRGAFTAPNWWGYPSGTSPVSTYLGCMHGYLCPFADPNNYSFSFNFNISAVNDPTRWISVFLNTTDAAYDDTANQTSGYHLLVRQNGTVQFFKKVPGLASALIATFNWSAFSLSTEYTLRVTVSPTNLTLDLMSGTSVVSTGTFADATYRGLPYFQLGRGGCAVNFRTLQVA